MSPKDYSIMPHGRDKLFCMWEKNENMPGKQRFTLSEENISFRGKDYTSVFYCKATRYS